MSIPYGLLGQRHLKPKTNQREVENRLVLAQVTICDEPAQEESDENPEYVEVGNRKRGLYTTPRAPATPSALWLVGTAPVVEPGGSLARM